jgi:hypothetical protein
MNTKPQTLEELAVHLQLKMDNLLAENARLQKALETEHELRLTCERSAEVYHRSYNDLRAKECECQQRLAGILGS